MVELLMVPGLVLPECILELTILGFAALHEAVFPSIGSVVPAILQSLALASGNPYLVSLHRQLESIRVRILCWVEEIR